MSLRRALMSSMLAAAASGVLRAAPERLEVVSGGPTGEVAALPQADEVRVVFSEPMVPIGGLEKQTTRPPYFHMTPAVAGSFRWSGTTTLLFRPQPKLPFASHYHVRIDASARAISGRTLEKPYELDFTTPILRLTRVAWYRHGRSIESPLVLIIDFNQPVDMRKLAGKISASLGPAEGEQVPDFAEKASGELRKIDPRSAADFDAKSAAASAPRLGAVSLHPAAAWNLRRWPASPSRLVLETEAGVPAGTSLAIKVAADALGRQGDVAPGQAQERTVHLENLFFVKGFQCSSGCDPDGYDPLLFTSPVRPSQVALHLRVDDVTNPGKPERLVPAAAGEGNETLDSPSIDVTLDGLGFKLSPAHTYRVVIDRGLSDGGGQKLGYTWLSTLELLHQSAFVSLATGHGVWEASGGSQIPFSARNVTRLSEWIEPLTAEQLPGRIAAAEADNFSKMPDKPGRQRKLSPRPDVIASYGLETKALLSPAGTGLLGIALAAEAAIEKSVLSSEETRGSTLVQVTNMGVSVKDSPQNTLVFVTRLDNASPVAGARVAIRKIDGTVLWSGQTDARGLAMAPAASLRPAVDWWSAEFRATQFVVTAEKDGDVAYAASNWNEDIEPWSFGTEFSLAEAKPILRGALFADRGVYKPGETVHVKAILRSDAPDGMNLLPAETPVKIEVRDAHDSVVDSRTVALSKWSASDWTFDVPAKGPLGDYHLQASVEGQTESISGRFLVAAYRRPDFEVNVSVSAKPPMAGASLEGRIAGRYLFGAPMSGRDVEWTFSRHRVFDPPEAVRDRFPEERWDFLGRDWEAEEENAAADNGELQSSSGKLSASGELEVKLDTPANAGSPFLYRLEAQVTDVSRQRLAGRAEVLLHPAPWYVGVSGIPYFVDPAKGADPEVVAVSPDGTPQAGVPVTFELTQVQWVSVRREESKGFYAWESKKKLVPAGTFQATTAEKPVALHVAVPEGGYYRLTATARDAEGRATRTVAFFYATGGGYTAWQRYDHPRIDLVPERRTYRPGQTARILVKSPWDHATALLTTEREGVRTERPFQLTSTQQTIEVPITEADIPNVYVSVLLVRGRTKAYAGDDPGDPGKPAFRLGYVELKVENARKRLAVAIAADREEYRPGASASIAVSVKDSDGHGAASEVTLWAVDQGVLSLTGYRTPDVLPDIYIAKALEVLNEDSRERIISRRVITPKGAETGGGGGRSAGGPEEIRKDFRVLAFWLGSVETDSSGRARRQVKLPESLTAYRIMAVAADRSSRFGLAERRIRIAKPVMLQGAFPRFLSRGDRARFGAVAFSNLPKAASGSVSIESLDPSVLQVVGSSTSKLELPAGGSSEVAFDLTARAAGRARLRLRLSLGGEKDAFEDSLPVEVVVTPETVAAVGSTADKAVERLALPAAALPEVGGLHVALSSTALSGLSEGARYLVDYPYGCAEQRGSSALALLLAAQLSKDFSIEGIPAGDIRKVAQETIAELAAFQTADGGFSYWKGDREASPFLTAYLLHVDHRARAAGLEVDAASESRALDYLDGELRHPRAVEASWLRADRGFRAFAASVLTAAGRNADSEITALAAEHGQLPVFGSAFLLDAVNASHPGDERRAGLRRNLENATLPEGASAHVEEVSDDSLAWLWSSNIRSTAIALGALVRDGLPQAMAERYVRWLLDARKNGRWGNTQENAWAMEALIDYEHRFESEPPDFSAAVRLAATEVVRAQFRGRSSQAQTADVPMARLVGIVAGGGSADLSFTKEGAGRLHYAARLTYSPAEPPREALAQGFTISRAYSPEKAAKGAPIAASTEFSAGELVRVTLTLDLPKERRFVAVTDPLPAGFEAVEARFETTSSREASRTDLPDEDTGSWLERWRRGGFDHVEKHDDRVLLFATRLSEGRHVFSYLVRATTSGTFTAGAARAEEMYEPEVFGRSGAETVTVRGK